MGNKKQNRLERTRKDPRTKRRTPFEGNRHTSGLKDGVSSQAQEEVIPVEEANAIELDSSPAISASARKLRLSIGHNIDGIDDVNPHEPTLDTGYVLFDVNIFMTCFSDIGKCQNCGADVTVMHQIDEKKGFCHLFKVSCDENCGWYESVYTSKEINRGKRKKSI